MKKYLIGGVFLLILVLLLTACSSKSKQASKQSPDAVLTAAAQTAEAKRLLSPEASPTKFADTLSATSQAPEAGTQLVSNGEQAAQATVTKLSAGSLPVSADDRAEFVDDVTVPDGAKVAPNDAFVKTWQLKNSGATTWSEDYALVFIDGDLLGASPIIPLQTQVAPGETVNLSIELTAPAREGTYKGFWKLLNSKHEVFGLGADALDAFWFVIIVSKDAEPLATATPTPETGTILTSAFLAIDNANFQGACPHKFSFTGYFNLSKPSTVTYSLESENDAGVEINLPQPITKNLDAGKHTIYFELTIPKSLKGWVRLKFISPEVINSNQVNFALTCQ